MSDVLGILIGVLTAVTLAIGLVGLAVKYALLPWLRENLVKKVEETHHQVTVNKHESPEPTVLDKLDSIADLFDDHLEHSAGELERIWSAIDELRKERDGY